MGAENSSSQSLSRCYGNERKRVAREGSNDAPLCFIYRVPVYSAEEERTVSTFPK